MDDINQILYLDKKQLFKLELVNLLGTSVVKSKLLAAGDISFASDWRDNAIQTLISAGVIVSVGTIAVLVAAGIIIALPGITIPISLAGLGVGLGYTHYRNNKKSKEYDRIVELFQGREIQDDLNSIIDNIISLYENTIVFLTSRDVQKLSKAFADVIIRSIKKGKVTHVDDLLNQDSLYELLIAECKHIPKLPIETAKLDSKKRNTRSAITKTGLYCSDTRDIYSTEKSRVQKYGLAFFKNKADLDQVVGSGNNDVFYRKINPHKSERILNNSIFGPNRKIEVSLIESNNDTTESLSM